LVIIREEEPEDIAAIRGVNVEAFGQSVEADIVDAIRQNCEDALSLVAVVQERIVGHILFSPVTIECAGKVVRGMGLGPMAVLPRHQREGIGSELVRAGIALLKDRRCPYVVVVGHPEYYPRFGFEPASRRGTTCEWKVPDDVFMIVVLSEPEMRGVTGLAKYRAEFASAETSAGKLES
jgi:putative acetyltransferase